MQFLIFDDHNIVLLNKENHYRNRTCILFFIYILLSLTITIGSIIDFSSSLTLIPASPVNDKITLSICGAVRNSESKDNTFTCFFYLDEEKESTLFYEEVLQEPAKPEEKHCSVFRKLC